MKGFILRECEICGAEFRCTHGAQRLCPECRDATQHGKGINTTGRYEPPINVEAYEKEIRERYMARYKDTIVAIGYADRQREQTLKMVGKVKVEL